MRILYAIQGTGNGHVARATDIVPLLKEMAETDVLISGVQSDLALPFEVNYWYYGLSFIFGKKGGVDIGKTLAKSKFFRFFKDIRSLPVEKYDLIITDFEPVSAWACKLKGKYCIGLSHQNAVLDPRAPKPVKKDILGKFILKNYTPVKVRYGFHFEKIGEQIFTPVIRNNIRRLKVEKKGYYTVYLPAYSDQEIIRELSSFKNIKWEVFSKHAKTAYEAGNIIVRKVSSYEFEKSFQTCDGILCSAGFETPAEAMYLGKKLCVIPMKNQYEQQCNAAFLESMGVTVLPQLRGSYNKLEEWLSLKKDFRIAYPDQTKAILEMIISKHPASFVR